MIWPSLFPKLPPRELRRIVAKLIRYHLLEKVTGASSPDAAALSRWRPWSPAAAFFHFSTRDLYYADSANEDFRGLREIVASKPLPPLRKSYPLIAAHHLPKPRLSNSFASVCLQRRTWREFSSKPVSLQTLSNLLSLSFGVHGWARIEGVGHLPLTTYPSGGCLHPLEAYVAAARIQGLPPAVYHYDSVAHQLARVAPPIDKRELAHFLGNQPWFAGAAFVVFLTAVFPRSQWKYPNSRAYRVLLAEAGHAGQTFCLAATSLGLAPFGTMALADSAIDRALGLDGVQESVLYALGAGHRPRRPATADRLRSPK